MATATFIENDFGTPVAWELIYDSWWFEVVMAGLAISFLANIFKYRLYKKEKWAILLFHLSFLVILLGAAITRYTAEAGVMRIREGQQSSTVISSDNYLRLHLTRGKEHHDFDRKTNLSALTGLPTTIPLDLSGTEMDLIIKEFIPDAELRVEEGENEGQPMIELVVSRGQGRETILLKKGEIQALTPQLKLGYEASGDDLVNFRVINGEVRIQSPIALDYFKMSDQTAGKISKDSLQSIALRTLLRKGDLSFVPLRVYENATMSFVSTSKNEGDNEDNKDDIVRCELQLNGETQEINLLYRSGFLPISHRIALGGYSGTISFGARSIDLPFAIFLEDFQLERYPGSTSPSSYASEVQVVDGDTRSPYRIHMNHVLDHKGYRFYQASYDTDELGTVLSVNRDRPGTYISYLGYLLMGLGMFFTLFGKQSHFRIVNRKLKRIKQQKQLASLTLLLATTLVTAQPPVEITPVLPDHQAAQFGRILVQDLDGRIKPINSLASEFLRKISRKTYLEMPADLGMAKLTPEQVFLSMYMAPEIWRNIPLIKIDTEKLPPDLRPQTLSGSEKFSFNAFLDPQGNYLLAEAVEEANLKKPAERNETDKEVIKVDERFNIVFGIFQGDYLRIFPKANDPENTWFAPTHDFNDFAAEDARFAKNILPLYFDDVMRKNWEEANGKLEYIRTYQEVLAAEIIPGEKKINAELLYNELNINFWMFQLLFTTGAILLVIAVARIFTASKWLDYLWNITLVVTLIGFLVFTGNLILRWYVGGHAPWSNGYEMLVFVSWVLLLCGFLTFRKSDFALPLASLFSGALLFVSYLDWLNPEITNLMPVLKSYWLKVHVATIVSSYAPLALSAILGLMVMILMIIRNTAIAGKIDLRIKELTYINEISMTIGVFVLAVGTFLGGVWANESWGRYWAWDPKETWALISIIVYAVVLHLRLIPKFNNPFVLNVSSMFAFWSIIMTSFGVNYYLSGLHSYAAGDPVPIPFFVYVLFATMVVLSFLAWFRFGRKVKVRL
ncbi:cytochrome c biogenesis protein [Robertkochia marina]|nr:cytochrome c biogenesis protein CcsA [Robertkochia marina]